jgi:Flp pilus assembly protein CpaB
VIRALHGPFRLSLVVWLVAAVIGAGGIVYLALDRNTEPVYVAVRDLPAYHQLTADDLRLADIRAPADAIRDQHVLVGHYTLVPIEHDRPFQSPRLGPRLAAGALTGPLIAVRAAAETTMGGRLARGDRVDVVLPDSRLPDALVVDIVDGTNAAVILQVPADDVAGVAAVRRADGPVIMRTRPYSGP